MSVRAERDGRWERMLDTPDGPKGQTGEAKDMPKDQAPGA